MKSFSSTSRRLIILALFAMLAPSLAARGLAEESEVQSNGNAADHAAWYKGGYASRALPLSELDLVFRNGVFIVDKNHDSQERAHQADVLGLSRHLYALPPLLAVSRDTTDEYYTRVNALQGLATIPHPQVVDLLLDFLRDPEPGIARAAYEHLMRLTGHNAYPSGISLDPDPNSQMRKDFEAEWRKWWAENRDKMDPSFSPPHSGHVPWQVQLRWRDEREAEEAAFFERQRRIEVEEAQEAERLERKREQSRRKTTKTPPPPPPDEDSPFRDK